MCFLIQLIEHFLIPKFPFLGIPWLFEMISYGLASDGFQLSFSVNLFIDIWNLLSVSRYEYNHQFSNFCLSGPSSLPILSGQKENLEQFEKNCYEKKIVKTDSVYI